MEYVNEAVSTNETSIGAFLGGAAIREFVQPPLYELAAHARADKESIQATQVKCDTETKSLWTFATLEEKPLLIN